MVIAGFKSHGTGHPLLTVSLGKLLIFIYYFYI